MKNEEALRIVIDAVKNTLDEPAEITDTFELLGGHKRLDSMKIVEVCLFLEDAASDLGFEFDWTSENAMSQNRSMFRTVHTLAEEFVNQWEKMT